MMMVSNQPSPNRRKGRLLCAAKTRAGGCCQVRAEPGKTSDSGGSPIERGFGRSEVATKPELEAKFLLAAIYLVTS
jgi:hypothetical protein